MSGVYDNLINTALRLLKKKGQSVTWRHVTEGAPPDPTKPWIAGDIVETDYTVDIAFLPVDKDKKRVIQYQTGSVVPAGMVEAYMGQVSFTPALRDIVVRDGVEYKVANIDVYEPSGEPILYVMELEL